MSDLAYPLALPLGGDATMRTLADLRTVVRYRGDMRNTKRLPDALLDAEIQAAFGEGYELMESVNEGFFDTTDTDVTVIGQDYIALPSGTWKLRALDRLDGTEWEPLRRVGVKDRNHYGTQASKPLAHRLTFRGADLYPTPDAVYTLRFTYTPSAPTLDETPRNYYNGWDEYAVFGALLRLYTTQNRDASPWQVQVDRQRARILGNASRRDASQPQYLRLYEDEDEGHPDMRPTWSW